MLVLKFGGTSVQNSDAMDRVVSIVSKHSDEKVIVVSALAGVTNSLLDLIKRLQAGQTKKARLILVEVKQRYIAIAKNKKIETTFIDQQFEQLSVYLNSVATVNEFSQQSQAQIITFGDRIAAQLLQRIMSLSFQCDFVDSSLFLQSNQNYLNAEVNLEQSAKLTKRFLLPQIKNHHTIVVPGFVAANKLGQITALGRGGSDYSAACIANCLKADVLEIWTDVNGVMTCDPRRIANAKPVRKISYLEAQELAYFGGKVLHPKTIQPAYEKQIPIHVRNTHNIEDSGTVILPALADNTHFKAITCKSDITVITIHSNRMLGAFGFLSKVFTVFEEFQTSIDLIATSEVSISLTIDNTAQLKSIKDALRSFSTVFIQQKMAIVSLIGEGVKHRSGVAGDFFSVLNDINISMISLGASEVNLGIVINESDLDSALSILHNHFFIKLSDSTIFSSRKER